MATLPSDSERETAHFPGLSRIGALLADPGRAAMLWSLMDGSARPAGELTMIAGLSPSAASGHLAKLAESGLVALEVRGRHRYYRIATPEIAAAIEALAHLAQASAPARPAPVAARTVPLDMRYARTCYDHMAGELAVRVFDHLLARGWLIDEGGNVEATEEGSVMLTRWGIDVGAQRARKRRFACTSALERGA
jgi:DNA-binding transcriptional ArsR family regulator